MKVHILMAGVILLSFVFGFEVANSRERITYDLYKFTNGELDWTEQPPQSPKDRVSEDQIYVIRDKIFIEVPNAEWSSYEPTGSMLPILSETANGLYVTPKGPEDLRVGDIIAYEYPKEDKDIVHRIIEITKDEYGNYFYITQGDANPVPDPEPVPYRNVKRVLIGVVY